VIIIDSFNFFPKYFDYLRRKLRQNVLSRCFLRFVHFFKKKTGNENLNKLPGSIGLYPIRYVFFFNFAAFFDKMFCPVIFLFAVFLLPWNVNWKLLILSFFFIAEILQFLRFFWNIFHGFFSMQIDKMFSRVIFFFDFSIYWRRKGILIKIKSFCPSMEIWL
jgi:hypothetical protein